MTLALRKVLLVVTSLIVCVFVLAFVPARSAYAELTRAQVDALYPGGMWGIRSDFDEPIYNNVRYCLYGNSNPAKLISGRTYRDCVNNVNNIYNYSQASGSYMVPSWISLAGSPSVQSTTVDAGNRTINLQMNTMIFIGNTLAKRNGKASITDCALDYYKIIGSGTTPNADDYPGSIGDNCRSPAKTGENYKVTGVSASSGRLVQNLVGKTYDATRKENTRYWTGDTAKFQLQGNFQTSEVVTITLRYRNISNYNGVYKCDSKFIASWTSFGDCKDKTQTFRITITVKPTPPNITPSVSISPSTVGIGDTVTDGLSFKNTGQTNVAAAYWYELVVYDKNSSRVAEWSRGMSDTNRWHTTVNAGQTWNLASTWSGDWTNIIRNGTRVMSGSVDDLIGKSAKVCINIWRSGITLTPSGTVNTPSDGLVQDCTTIAKTPALTVTDGDLRVGGSFTSNAGGVCTLPVAVLNNNNPYGIWTYEKYGTSRSSLGQYAATTPGLITGYGSKGVPYKSISGWNSLLFGTEGFPGYGYNGFFLGPLLTTGNIPALGTGTTSYCLPNTASMYTTTAGTQSIATNESVTNADLTSDASYRFTGNDATLNLSKQSGVVLGKGQRRIIKVTQPDSSTGNTIVIKGPITYTTTGYSSIVELPQFILVADGKIDIQFDGNPAIPTFTVDGIISTKGNVYTCNTIKGDTGDTLTWSGQCSTQLVVNGAIIAAGRVLPYRTYGFDKSTDTSTYAEEFNLTADTLLGDYARTEGSGLTVDYQSELPARY